MVSTCGAYMYFVDRKAAQTLDREDMQTSQFGHDDQSRY